ncbi:unnamed protein product [Fusarium fujikuroi]|nr:unnamed protein product [Fusarium fujikuroi]VZI10183.1 unnamed protein product [Fusarium fujikuroi]
MDDPAYAWPAWKFGMKKEDLSNKLHDQYNTYLAPIQSPEAFYHDISEIAHAAHSSAEFHRLALSRRQQRLNELNEALESASFEIIGNPSLIETPQWEHAIQLFRTNSLDSLVQYFASYLPREHCWHPLRLRQDSVLSGPDGSERLNKRHSSATARKVSQTPGLSMVSRLKQMNTNGGERATIIHVAERDPEQAYGLGKLALNTSTQQHREEPCSIVIQSQRENFSSPLPRTRLALWVSNFNPQLGTALQVESG